MNNTFGRRLERETKIRKRLNERTLFLVVKHSHRKRPYFETFQIEKRNMIETMQSFSRYKCRQEQGDKAGSVPKKYHCGGTLVPVR
ncbi:MAG: hypothetical protein IKG96_10300 [Bacteroidaceae bacterium]|nr:hypothetical protein [Bacteroidaceae bacterium]